MNVHKFRVDTEQYYKNIFKNQKKCRHPNHWLDRLSEPEKKKYYNETLFLKWERPIHNVSLGTNYENVLVLLSTIDNFLLMISL